ncbi:hypothetical protein TWF281_010286 [Arthrobotrys megalospora]
MHVFPCSAKDIVQIGMAWGRTVCEEMLVDSLPVPVPWDQYQYIHREDVASRVPEPDTRDFQRQRQAPQLNTNRVISFETLISANSLLMDEM